MAKSTWYLTCYDVAEKRRRQRLHRHLRQQAQPLQKSVFLVEGNRHQVDVVLNRVAKIIHDREDDVRAYPIQHPSQLWLYGQTNIKGFTLQPGQRDKPAKRKPAGETKGLVASLLARFRGHDDER